MERTGEEAISEKQQGKNQQQAGRRFWLLWAISELAVLTKHQRKKTLYLRVEERMNTSLLIPPR